MRKIILSFSLLVFTVSGFSQVIKPVKIDSLVTVSLPAGYQKKDTLNQHIFSVNGLFGYIVVIRAPNDNNTALRKEKDLNKVLKDYVKGIKGESAGASTMNIRDTIVGTLKAKNFTLRSDDGNGNVQLRNFILLYTQQVTYTFEYVYPENRTDLVKDEYKAFASSIKLSPQLQRDDQYLLMTKGISNVKKLALFGLGVIIISVISIIIVMKKRKARRAGQ